MRVLHFITSLRIGGAEATLFNLLEHLNKRHDEKNHHAVLYIYDGPFVNRIKALGIPVYQLKGAFSPYDPVSFYRLSRFIKTIKPDVIHSSLWSANIMARFVSWLYKTPLICDLHGDCQYHGAVRNFFERITVFVPAKFVAVSHSVDKSFVKMFGANKNVLNNTVLIHNGIDGEKFIQKAKKKPLTRESAGFGVGDFIIGSVGRLHPIKQQDLLIKALAMLVRRVEGGRRIRLCLVGDGSERLSLERLSRDLGVENQVSLTGACDEPYRYYPLFDCFALSSQSEGLSIALLEALCFGLPIVTTNKNKYHDVITDGINGYIIPVNNVNSLCDAFEKLYMDDSISMLMKKENVFLVNKKFHIEVAARRYIELFQDVISKKAL